MALPVEDAKCISHQLKEVCLANYGDRDHEKKLESNRKESVAKESLSQKRIFIDFRLKKQHLNKVATLN